MVDIEIIPVGGYNEFGRNMTVVRVGSEAIILDMGLRLDRILIHEDAVFESLSPDTLWDMGAIPDDRVLDRMDARVVAIVIGHGHLDHLGAVPKLAQKYNVPIYCTPYTARLLEAMHQDREGKMPYGNQVVSMNAGQSRRLTEHVELEFVHTTHSIVQTVFPILHTPRGAIVYACDFKLDNQPVIGSKPDYQRLAAIGSEGVLAVIQESTNADDERKCPSENIARELLRDAMAGQDNDGKGLVVTTFSSHVARIKSIVEFATQLDRKVVLCGRSLDKYMGTARDTGLMKLSGDIRTCGYSRATDKALAEVMREGKDKYVLVVTGHQGEQGAVLTRMANRETPYKLDEQDRIVFSSRTIPSPVNIAQMHVLQTKLRMQGVSILRDVHVSGHAMREDHRQLLQYLEPEHIIPNHGEVQYQAGLADLAEGRGWRLNSTIHILRNGSSMKL